MNRFFQYIDPTDYEITNEGLMKACVAEVIAEAEDGIRDLVRSRGLGDVYKRQILTTYA